MATSFAFATLLISPCYLIYEHSFMTNHHRFEFELSATHSKITVPGTAACAEEWAPVHINFSIPVKVLGKFSKMAHLAEG